MICCCSSRQGSLVSCFHISMLYPFKIEVWRIFKSAKLCLVINELGIWKHALIISFIPELSILVDLLHIYFQQVGFYFRWLSILKLLMICIIYNRIGAPIVVYVFHVSRFYAAFIWKGPWVEFSTLSTQLAHKWRRIQFLEWLVNWGYNTLFRHAGISFFPFSLDHLFQSTVETAW